MRDTSRCAAGFASSSPFLLAGLLYLGSGLGLAIVREIAEVHQAAASLRPNNRDIEADEPSGCVARIVFPVYSPQRSQALAQDPVQTGFA